MASFPSAAAQFSAQRQDPLEQYGRVVALQNLMRNQQFQQQMQPLQLQQAQQQVQQGQMSLQSQQAMQKAFQESPGDPDKIIQLAGQYGALPQDLLALQSHFLDVREKLANTSKAELTNSLARHDQARSLIQGVLSAPPEDQPQLYAQAIAQARQQHLLDDIPPNLIPAEFPGADKLKQFGDGLVLSSTLTKEALEQAQTAHELASTAQLEPFTADRVDQLNQGLQSMWQTMHPGQPAPGWAQLQPGATFKDFERVNKLLDTSVQMQATQAQRATANAIREQTFSLAQEAANERKEKQEMTWAQWTDPNTGRSVAGPISAAHKAGAQDIASIPPTQVTAIQDARGVVSLINKKGSEQNPETMGINQLIDSLDRDGKLGIAASRLNSFLAGKVGAEPGDDPRIMALLDKSDLAMTLSMKAHFGASGGRSPAMLAHFLTLANARKMNAGTLKAGMNAVSDYMEDRGMIPGNQLPPKPPAQQNQSGGFDWNAHPVVKP